MRGLPRGSLPRGRARGRRVPPRARPPTVATGTGTGGYLWRKGWSGVPPPPWGLPGQHVLAGDPPGSGRAIPEASGVYPARLAPALPVSAVPPHTFPPPPPSLSRQAPRPVNDDFICPVSLPEVGMPGPVADPVLADAGGDGPMESSAGGV